MDYADSNKTDQTQEQEPVTEKVTVKKVERVVSGEVVQKKPTIGKKMKEIFFGGEFKSAGQYVIAEVLLPALRDLVVDTATKGVERVIYGESSYGPRRRRPEYRGRTSYSNYSNNPINPRVYEATGRERAHIPDQPMRPRSRRGGLEYIVQTRAEAEAVLEELSAALEKYDFVTVADIRYTLGLESQYTDNKWGWLILNDVEIRQVREGYLIDLPPAEALG